MRFPIGFAPLLTRAAFFILFILIAADSRAESLGRVLAALDSTSAVLADARLELAAARAGYTTGRALPNPALFAEQESWNDDSPVETTVGVRQNLGFLWSQRPRQASLRHTYAAARSRYTEQRRALHVDVINAANAYAGHRELAAVLDSVLARMEPLNNAIAARSREGDISRFEEQRFRIEALELEHRRQLLLEAQEAAFGELVLLTGLPDARLHDLTLDVIPSVPAGTLDDAERMALEQRPQIAAARSELQAAQAGKTAARLSQLPELTVGVGQKKLDAGPSGMVIEGELEIPLFNQRRSQAQLAVAALRRATVQLAAAKARVRREVRSAYTRWESLQGFRYSAALATADSADVNTTRAAALYLDGEISAVELVDALRTGIDARAAAIDLRNARIAAAADLRRAVGLEIME